MTRASSIALPLLVLLGACLAPDEGPEPGDWLDVSAREQEAGVTCTEVDPCSGGGSVYTSTYRVGVAATASAELLQVFEANAAGAPAKVTVALRNLRLFAAPVQPLLHADVYGPVSAAEPSIQGLTPLVSGVAPLAVGTSGLTTIALSGAGALAEGQTYALHLRVEADVTGGDTLLLGVGALAQGGGTGAFRRTARRPTPTATWVAARFQPAGPWSAAFAFAGGLASPCQQGSDCRSGLVCRLGSCFQPSTSPLVISPAAPTIATDTVIPFSASGGDAPYSFSLVAGAGSLSGASFSAPTTAGSATVRVTDSVGATRDAVITIVPATRIAACTGLPANASWNTASEITQSWTGSTWTPSTGGTYSTTASTTTCVFKCSANATWTGGACVAAPQPASFPASGTGRTGTLQSYVVPVTGTYRIEAWGAQGGGPRGDGGKGARIRGDFALAAGDVLRIVVGQRGGDTEIKAGVSITLADTGGGGGGASCVSRLGVPLLVAGGGGGASYGSRPGEPGRITTQGGSTANGGGGTNGSGGAYGGDTYSGSGGAGWSGSGGDAVYLWGSPYSVGGRSLSDTALGGTGNVHATAGAAGDGGFGGGGGALRTTSFGRGGGGGGYSGGQGSINGGATYGGAGGGSYNNGSNPVNTAGVRIGDGRVEITPL